MNYTLEEVITRLEQQREVLEAQLEIVKETLTRLERIDENNN